MENFREQLKKFKLKLMSNIKTYNKQKLLFMLKFDFCPTSLRMTDETQGLFNWNKKHF